MGVHPRSIFTALSFNSLNALLFYFDIIKNIRSLWL